MAKSAGIISATNTANMEKLGQYDSYWPSFSVLADLFCIGRVNFFLFIYFIYLLL